MSLKQDTHTKEENKRSFSALTDETSQRIIQILHGTSGSVTVRELAESLMTMTPDSEAEDAATDAEETTRLQLYHIHLPKLADNDVVNWDREEQLVTATDHPVYETDPSKVSESGDGTPIVPTLTDKRDYEILAIVESENGTTTRDEIARRLASRTANNASMETVRQDINIELHHIHLPRLEAADLLAYDHEGDSATVTFQDPPNPGFDRIANV